MKPCSGSSDSRPIFSIRVDRLVSCFIFLACGSLNIRRERQFSNSLGKGGWIGIFGEVKSNEIFTRFHCFEYFSGIFSLVSKILSFCGFTTGFEKAFPYFTGMFGATEQKAFDCSPTWPITYNSCFEYRDIISENCQFGFK